MKIASINYRILQKILIKMESRSLPEKEQFNTTTLQIALNLTKLVEEIEKLSDRVADRMDKIRQDINNGSRADSIITLSIDHQNKIVEYNTLIEQFKSNLKLYDEDTRALIEEMLSGER